MSANPSVTESIDKEFMNQIHSSLGKLFKEMSKRLIERDQLSRLIALTFFTRANCFLLGERGVAKSYAIDTLGNSIDETDELWQLTLKDDTKIEEIFGRTYTDTNGDWKINTKGSLLEADNIFLDEMFKAKGKVLNGVLELLVDRTYSFGDGKKHKTDILAFFAASNEYPTESYMLPYVDRIDYWIEIPPIRTAFNRKRFYMGDFLKAPIDEKLISKTQILKVIEESKKVIIPDNIMNLYVKITINFRKALVKTSDRKYSRIIKNIKTIAYMNNRDYVNYSDLFILLYSAWQDGIEKERVERVLFETMFGKREEIRAYLSECNTLYRDCLNEFNSKLFRFFTHKYDFIGEMQNSNFLITRDNFKAIAESIEGLLKNIEEIEHIRSFNQKIQKELDDNIIILDVKERVFDEKLNKEISVSKNDMISKRDDIMEWLEVNPDLFTYKNIQKENF